MLNSLVFNPQPHPEIVTLFGRHRCVVIDNALRNADDVIAYAAMHHDAFTRSAHNAYPGPELRLPDEMSAQLDGFFTAHVRRVFDVRRTERMYSRLAITATPSERLLPRQSICHIDRMQLAPGQIAIASVLYLFDDPRLGGTSFYAPKQPIEDIARLVADSATLDRETFTARHGLPCDYMTTSNAWFEKLATIPARRNRLIFYEGTVFHTGEITQPELLRDDPRQGRLSLNGFFLCRRALSA